MKIWVFLPLAFIWPSKNFLAFFQPSQPSDILNIPNHSNLNNFEAILPLKEFLLKIWQTGSVCNVCVIKQVTYGVVISFMTQVTIYLISCHQIYVCSLVGFLSTYPQTLRSFCRSGNAESTKQMKQTLRAKVKIFFRSEN